MEATQARNSSKKKIQVALRQVTTMPGYQYLKDIAFQSADALIAKLPVDRNDNTSNVGATMRQAYLILFQTIETQACKAPATKPVEILAVESSTQEVL
jgi:hypothetical protein